MTTAEPIVLTPVGRVVSTLTDPATAPPQADEGAPAAVVALDPAYWRAAADLGPGDRVVILTWLHVADRGVLAVHPRGEEDRPLTGVFSTRSPVRPNPIGLHEVTVVGVRPGRIDVDALEAIDGTPVLDLKPVLGRIAQR
jgi:tRNA-Thr(GGU) m(6)t(6)A37 methyltransferase TsaA